MTDDCNDSLIDTLARHAIELPTEQISQLDQYCKLLWHWNERLNLTRHTDYEKFVTRDLIDSLELAKLLDDGEKVLDIGTGGGVPGIVLAIVRPDLQLSLCDSVGKKMRAVGQMAGQMKLSVAIFHGRGENVLEDLQFTSLVARAVGPLLKMLKWLAPHWQAAGRLYAIKGPKWIEERNEARHHGLLQNLELRKVANYPVPGRDSDSVILKIWPK